jgi:hypothetical protein
LLVWVRLDASDLELRTTAELDAEHESTAEDGDDNRNEHEDRRDDVPNATLAYEVV